MSRYREGANNLEMFDMIARADTFVVGSGLIMGRLCLFVRITCVCVCIQHVLYSNATFLLWCQYLSIVHRLQ